METLPLSDTVTLCDADVETDAEDDTDALIDALPVLLMHVEALADVDAHMVSVEHVVTVTV